MGGDERGADRRLGGDASPPPSGTASEPFERLSPEEVARRAGSPTHLAGVLEPTGATVQPALLARGLRRVALERGVRIFERLADDAGSSAATPAAGPHAPAAASPPSAVVLAMNAWLAQIGSSRASIFVLASDMVATEPIPERLAEIGLTDGIAISDSRLLVNYYRTTLDGRIAFGQGGGLIARGGQIGPDFHGAAPAARAARRWRASASSTRRSPTFATPVSLDRARSTARTTGFRSSAASGGRPDIVFGGGYSGNGVGPAYLGGQMLASLALGLDDEWSHVALACLPPRGGLPPEPIRYPGAHVVRAAVARKERAEDAGRRSTRSQAYRRARARGARPGQEGEEGEVASARPRPRCVRPGPSAPTLARLRPSASLRAGPRRV